MLSETITIRVRKSGGDNRATIPGKNIKASCTMGDRAAAQRALSKYLEREKLKGVTTTWDTVTDNLRMSVWDVTIKSE